jgi:very-short-patch-repair endonuclease
VILGMVPTQTLPRKRERGLANIEAAHHAMPAPIRNDRVISSPSVWHSAPPLPLAGEGWGGGIRNQEIAMDDPKKPTWKVRPRLRTNARTLRRNSTDAERLLWSELRDHRLNGARFRRQVPIENFIADFVCHAAKLVIERDGGQHYSNDGEQADSARTAVIEGRGFRVLRFTNLDVITNRAEVLETIVAAVGSSAPTPTLPRKREREQAGAGGSAHINSDAEISKTKGPQP